MPSDNAGNAAPPAGAPNANGTNGAASGSGANNQGGESKTVPLAELMQEREKRQAMQTELEALKATVANLAAGSANNSAQPGSRPQPDPRADLENLWREDPRRAMQAEIVMAMNWRDQVESTVDSAVDQASKKYQDFGTYSADVRHYLRQLPADQRAKPGVVDAAYFMVKGQKTESLIEAEVKARIAKMQGADGAQGAGGGSSGGGDGQAKSNVLSADQKRVAAAMGLSEEEYSKHIR